LPAKLILKELALYYLSSPLKNCFQKGSADIRANFAWQLKSTELFPKGTVSYIVPNNELFLNLLNLKNQGNG
jgi:hypothetical protein